MKPRFPVTALFAWLLVAVSYFYQYALRSAPSVGLIMGIASGAAMLPYTVIKQVNPPSGPAARKSS